MNTVTVKDFLIGKDHPLAMICGPCVIESEDHAFSCAKTLKEMLAPYPFSFIFKASYDKANRSSIHSFRGPGLLKGIHILERIKKELDLPVTTDVHTPQEALLAAKICDMIQIPAFLCRQTDLLLAAAKTKVAINIKKGQFMAPWDMKHVIEKIESQNHHNILLTDRGTSFGYNNLVSDFRSILLMQSLNYPVCYDASHSTQLPGSCGVESGGQSEFIAPLAKAALVVGANALFIETHPDPKNAKSDKMSVMDFKDLNVLLQDLYRLYKASYEKIHAPL